MYVIARTAKRNPRINGQTLYLTKFGLWSLDREQAWKFKTETEAQQVRKDDAECSIEKAED